MCCVVKQLSPTVYQFTAGTSQFSAMSEEAIDVSAVTGILPYLRTINWTERWLHALLGFHVLCLVMTFLTRKHNSIQAVIFILYLGLVYFSETINEFAAQNWRSFSKEQYFDSNGLFISLVFSTPLLVNCLIILVSWLYDNYKLMIKVAQAKKKRASKPTEDNTAAAVVDEDDDASPTPANSESVPESAGDDDFPSEAPSPEDKKDQ